MKNEIVNRVAQSNLILFDLEDFYPEGTRILLDIKDWLIDNLILKEQTFRQTVKNHDWAQYKNTYVAIYCSSDAIIPAWAYMLITTSLTPFAKKTIVGNLEQLETSIFQDILSDLTFNNYKNKPVIIKGCSSKPIPNNAYIMLVEKLLPIVKSIMYGEACSSVPLYKKK